MKDELSIRVPTAQLRKLLEDQPEIALKLESFACEKIAEELIRKASRAIPDVASITRTAEYAADQAIKRKLDDLKNRWSMPDAVMKVIRDEVARVVEIQVKTALDGVMKKAREALAHEIASAIETAEQRLRDIALQQRAEFAAHMEERVAILARQSFFQVLKEAKEGVA